MSFDPRHVVRAGQTYLIPSSLEDGFQLFTTLSEMTSCSDWLCLCLETGDQLVVADFFLEPSRLVSEVTE